MNIIKENWNIIEEKIIKPMYEDGYFSLTLADEITKILQQQLNNGWIPVSDGKLPKENGYYNVSAKSLVPVFTAFFMDGDFYYWMSQVKIDRVIAWQPLPHKYKEESL